MKNPRISIWRRRIGVFCTVVGCLFFAASRFLYIRYASSSLHDEERLRHAQALGVIWGMIFLGSPFLLIVSIFGLGWSRWAGVVLYAAAFVDALAILGSRCGLYGCT